MAFARLKQWLGAKPGAGMEPLYSAVVAQARQPDWYAKAAVPDTLDGRFEMVTLITAATILRLEREGDRAGEPMAVLTECYVADMEAQIREVGIGDVVVGKHVGRMMSALGGRIGSLRGATTADARTALLSRTVWSEATPSPEQQAEGAALLAALIARLDASSFDELMAGRIAA